MWPKPEELGVECKPILLPFVDFKALHAKDFLARSYGYMPTHKAEAQYRTHMAQFYFERKLDVFDLISQGLAEDADKLNLKL